MQQCGKRKPAQIQLNQDDIYFTEDVKGHSNPLTPTSTQF